MHEELEKNEDVSETLITKAENISSIGDTKAFDGRIFKAAILPEVQPTGKTPYEKEIQKQIISVFNMFDNGKTGKLNTVLIGTIIRSLGFCPNEAEVRDLLTEAIQECINVQVEEEERGGCIHLTNILPVLTNVVLEDRFKPSTKERITEAFKTLDFKNKGYLTKDEIADYLCDYGEQFISEELEEFLKAAKDPVTNRIYYLKFSEQLIVPKIFPL